MALSKELRPVVVKSGAEGRSRRLVLLVLECGRQKEQSVLNMTSMLRQGRRGVPLAIWASALPIAASTSKVPSSGKVVVE